LAIVRIETSANAEIKGRLEMRKLIARAVFVLIASGVSSVAYAGEVTGGPNPKPTQGSAHASSVCAFSGQEDGFTLLGFNLDGSPIIVPVDTGPGLVQTPHQENSYGIIHAPGIPGDACRGNADSDL
jgi:hypothetical protein